MNSFFVRPAMPDDALGINTHLHRVAEEENNMISYSPGEFDRTVSQDRTRIESALAADNSQIFVAVADYEIIGLCSCFGGVRVGKYTTSLGITVKREWRDHGVGTALMQAAIQWARENPEVHRLELGVLTSNERAIHLYRKLGFQDEGIRKEAYFKEGKFLDSLTMGIVFPEE